ncbi:MAG: hypothetical protein WA268_10615 [Xanthobacteraceae bacterium]|jgi:hypothetical protein
MNKIIREHYPAAQLPEDLRPNEDPNARVTVIIEEEEQRPDRVLSLEDIWAMRERPFRTKEEIDSEIRRQRDEWDD